ncbi:MAG: PilT/PilU family type 4a pilus ATPase [Kiritimatiellaeota bacterium]|nr:PilT/PilU family type 4a pilus ATPase [Kiritimatiellota bacterium]
MASEESRLLGFPKDCVLGGAAGTVGAAPAADLPAATEPEPFERVEALPIEVEEPELPVEDGGLGRGWPDLGLAETLPREEARGLLTQFLEAARGVGCSDVHISAGARPFVRLNKAIHVLTRQPVITAAAAENLNLAPLSSGLREDFEKTHDLDWCYAVKDNERYRVNLMLQRLGVAGSYRIIDGRIRSIRELGFPDPEIIEKLTTYHQGLILVTGPAGCGKSTTLAALIDLINRNRKDHIITIEDPIEVVHRPKSCNVTQREIGRHTRSFSNALRAALREDPDIIVIGELRDLETIEMAIRAAETGHLVIGTLHTGDASSTMDRILDVFPPGQQAQVRSMAAESLKGVICQQLLPNKDGDGLALAVEIMLGTLAVSNIIREGDTFQLPSVIQTSYNIGMRLLEQSVFDLYEKGQLSYEQASPKIRNPDLLHQMQASEARRMAAEQGGPEKKKRRWF